MRRERIGMPDKKNVYENCLLQRTKRGATQCAAQGLTGSQGVFEVKRSAPCRLPLA